MKILQLLPELDAGGVERGTLEIADHLVHEGHEALVVSNGGRQVAALERLGARHVTMPVHKKRLSSLGQVGRLRRLFADERPDVVHARSRVPAWLAWLAWRGMPAATRPRFVTTVHGFYSTNPYSAIMTRGERVIAVSASVRAYVENHYKRTPMDRVRVIHRGVSPAEFPRGHRPATRWLDEWRAAHPGLAGKEVLLLPGRLTRWKGHEDFLELLAALKTAGRPAHGLIAGAAHARKADYDVELRARAETLGVAGDVTFLGHRADLREVMAVSDVVFSLSREPEAFGRVSLEAAALGRPVIGYDHGGVAEQLRVLYPQGLVPVGDAAALRATVERVLAAPGEVAAVEAPFTLEAMQRATLEVYRDVVAAVR